MIVEICEQYLFKIFGIGSLQCACVLTIEEGRGKRSQTATQNCQNEGGGLFANILTCEQK
jgi:hypothetical protein